MTEAVAQVIAAVANQEDTPPERLPPLQRAIDADCLNHFFADGMKGLGKFDYFGYSVTYHSDGSVELQSN